jgi:hypothetical protein
MPGDNTCTSIPSIPFVNCATQTPSNPAAPRLVPAACSTFRVIATAAADFLGSPPNRPFQRLHFFYNFLRSSGTLRAS